MSVPYPVELYPGCPCLTCDSKTWPPQPFGLLSYFRLSLCPSCGSKRCKGAVDHERGCVAEIPSGAVG